LVAGAVLVCACEEEAGGCADWVCEGAVVALLSDFDDGDWPDCACGRWASLLAFGFWADCPVVSCRLLAGADCVFCEVDADPPEEEGAGAWDAGEFGLGWLCAVDGAGDLSLGDCALSVGDCAKAPVPIKTATAVVTNKDCFMIILSSMFGLTPEIRIQLLSGRAVPSG
jgi:hypothetical protein